MAEAPGVLLIEDSENDVFFFLQAMKKVGAGFPLQTVPDGAAAIAYLSGSPPYSDRSRFPLPRLVLLDLKLPKRSGFEVLEWIHSDSRLGGVKVLILTSSAERPDVIKAYDLGAILYIAKPIGMDLLRGLIRAIDGYWNDLEHGPQSELVAYSLPRP